jgi:hypothetical protein
MPCPHVPPCPDAHAVDRDAAQVIASYPQQGWSLLCNGVIVFEDTGELLPDGSTIPPQRGPAPHAPATRPRTAGTTVAEVTTTPAASSPTAAPAAGAATAGTPAAGAPTTTVPRQSATA